MAIPEVSDYVDRLPPCLVDQGSQPPWVAASEAAAVVAQVIGMLPAHFEIRGDVAIHRSATVHSSVVITGPTIVDEGAVVGPYCRLREGVYLGRQTSLGPSTEVKSSFVNAGSALAHLNYVGNSVIGEDVNLEAGVVVANHFNERVDKVIFVLADGERTATGVTKFGAAIGSGSRIGANAVTTPGTLLRKNSIVGRLELVDQIGAAEA